MWPFTRKPKPAARPLNLTATRTSNAPPAPRPSVDVKSTFVPSNLRTKPVTVGNPTSRREPDRVTRSFETSTLSPTISVMPDPAFQVFDTTTWPEATSSSSEPISAGGGDFGGGGASGSWGDSSSSSSSDYGGGSGGYDSGSSSSDSGSSGGGDW